MTRPVWFVALIAAITIWSALLVSARAEESDLAAAMKDATATLQGGIKASESEGIPLSAKFEIEDGKLQLSVYTMKGDSFMEVVADPQDGGDRQGGENHGCRRSKGGDIAEGSGCQSEGVTSRCNRCGREG